MKIILFNLVALLGGANLAHGFVNTNNNPMVASRSQSQQAPPSSLLQMADNKNFDADAYAKSMSAAAIEQMKNLKPGDIDRMIKELDEMNPIQKQAMKAMNMDVSCGCGCGCGCVMYVCDVML